MYSSSFVITKLNHSACQTSHVELEHEKSLLAEKRSEQALILNVQANLLHGNFFTRLTVLDECRSCAFAFRSADFTNPDIAEPHRVSMILKSNR